MKKFYLIVLLSILYFNVKAQQWEPTYGPSANIILTLEKFNNKLFVGSEWGTYSSVDNGTSWQNISLIEHTNDFVKCGSKLFAASWSGVYSTTDGVTWNHSDSISGGVKK